MMYVQTITPFCLGVFSIVHKTPFFSPYNAMLAELEREEPPVSIMTQCYVQRQSIPTPKEESCRRIEHCNSRIIGPPRARWDFKLSQTVNSVLNGHESVV